MAEVCESVEVLCNWNTSRMDVLVGLCAWLVTTYRPALAGTALAGELRL